MAGPARKSTKKFEKNHLKDTIERRKGFAKIKQKKQVKAKKQARRANETEKDAETEDQLQEKTGKRDLASMSVDDFFQNGFDLPEKAKKKARRSANASRPANEDDESEESETSPQPGVDIKPKKSPPSRNAISLGDHAVEESNGSEAEDGEGHQAELEALSKKDPEFYKFLQENDAELLDFNADMDLAVFESGDEGSNPKKSRKGDDSTMVTQEMVEKWQQAMETQKSMRAMRQAVLAFRAAAHINAPNEKSFRFTIPNPDVYNSVLVTTLRFVPTVLQHHLPVKESGNHKVRVATESKKFRTLSPLLKAHTTSMLYLLESLSDSATIKLTVEALMPLLPYILSFKKMLKSLIKVVVNIWSSPASVDEATLVTSYLLLRRLAFIADASIQETVLKQAYQGVVQAFRTTNTHTLPSINLLKNSCADLWAVNTNIGYTTGFVYIRQMAVHLRGCIHRPTKDSYKNVYNWQYVHSLDFWSRVLSSSIQSPLQPLIYPVVQITLGALRLIPTPTYFPLRFHLIRSLLRISRTTKTYIPLAPVLLEVLTSTELTKPPKASTAVPLDFNTCLRTPKQYLRSRVYQDSLGQQVQELFAEFFACWSKNIAFPELIIPPTTTLRRWLKSASAPPQKGDKISAGKGIKNSKVTNAIHLLLQKMQLNAEFVKKHRKNVTFTPSDREQVDTFLKDVLDADTPMGAFVDGLHKQRAEREKIMEASRQADEAQRRDERDEKEDRLRDELQKLRDQSDSGEDLDEQFAELEEDLETDEDE